VMDGCMNERGPILAFSCNWAPYRCYMAMAGSGNKMPHHVYPIRMMCTGRLDPALVLYAFEKGAEGVMVLGCKEKGCRYGPGPEQAEKNARPIREMMHALGLAPERLATMTFESHEHERFFEEITAFEAKLSRLGESPFRFPKMGGVIS